MKLKSERKRRTIFNPEQNAGRSGNNQVDVDDRWTAGGPTRQRLVVERARRLHRRVGPHRRAVRLGRRRLHGRARLRAQAAQVQRDVHGRGAETVAAHHRQPMGRPRARQRHLPAQLFHLPRRGDRRRTALDKDRIRGPNL